MLQFPESLGHETAQSELLFGFFGAANFRNMLLG
jgi:hypothetical protein